MKMKNTLTLLLAGLMAVSMTACSSQITGASRDNAKTNAASRPIYSANKALEEDGAITLTNVSQAKNLILLIGDGMGPEQVKAGEIYKGEQLAMQSFPYQTKHRIGIPYYSLLV